MRAQGIRVPRSNLFRKLRIRCERWSRRFGENHEVLLPDIYALLGRLMFWSASDRLLAEKIEREVEAEFLHKTTHGLAAVTEARLSGKRIVFVSDMYLDSDFLKTILLREGIAKEEDLVFVSGEWKVSKASGEIWPRLLEKLSITPDQIFHQGDHEHSDVASPARYGISSKRLGTSVVSRWEQWDERSSTLPAEGWGGIAALGRISRAACEKPDDYWTRIGTGLVGPWMLGFAVWILAEAKKRGILTLWFLSRDGWNFYQAALALSDAEGIELHYIAINRIQLRFATEGARPIEELFDGTRLITWCLLQERLALTDEDLTSLQKCCDCGNSRIDDTLSAGNQDLIRAVLKKPEWVDLLEKRAQKAGVIVKTYLAQCVQDNTRIAIVDVGWRGRSQQMLQQLHPEIIHGFYIGLCNERAQDDKQAWLYDLGRGKGVSSLNQHQRMIEVFIGVNVGPLTGYKQVNGKWQGVFQQNDKKEVTSGRDEMHRAAMVFIQHSQRDYYKQWLSPTALQAFTAENLLNLLEYPVREDADFFRFWQITTDDAHQDAVYPAAGYDRKRILSCLQKEQPWSFLWPAASLHHTGFICRLVMKMAWQTSRFLK